MSKIILAEQAAPDTPSSEKVAIYPKTDGLLYQKNDAGTELLLAFNPAAPGAIGGTTPAAGAFTTVSATTSISLNSIATLSAASNTDVDTGTETVDSFSDTLGHGAIWMYTAYKTTNIRTGIVMAAWDATGDTVEYTETRTLDVGDTSGLSLSVDIDSNTVRLRATAGADDWAVKVQRTIL